MYNLSEEPSSSNRLIEIEREDNLYRSVGFVAYGIEPRALRHAGRDYDEAMMVLMIDNPP